MSARQTMTVEVLAGQAVRLSGGPVDSGEIVITLESKSGKRARFRIEAEASIKIKRPAERNKTPA